MDYYEELSGSNLLKYTGDSKNVVVPDEVNGYKIFRIGKRVLAGKNMSSLSIGRNVANIGERAMANNKNIASIELPDSVKMIEKEAFYRCTDLKTANLNKVMHICDNAFKLCRNLEKVYLGDECKYISETAFIGCSKNLKIEAPEGSYAWKYAKETRFSPDTLSARIKRFIKKRFRKARR